MWHHMSAMASQITSTSTVCSTTYSRWWNKSKICITPLNVRKRAHDAESVPMSWRNHDNSSYVFISVNPLWYQFLQGPAKHSIKYMIYLFERKVNDPFSDNASSYIHCVAGRARHRKHILLYKNTAELYTFIQEHSTLTYFYTRTQHSYKQLCINTIYLHTFM